MRLSEPKTDVFQELKIYSRANVELNNCFSDLFRSATDWPLWIQEGLGSLLNIPSQPVVLLQQANQVETGETHKWSFPKNEISIGREQDNDIVIAVSGVGRHHARIVRRGAHYFLEDLGSANGTYLNDSKLSPNEPAVLNEGTHFLIFPHQFTFSTKEVWIEHEPIRVAGGGARLGVWADRQANRFGGSQYFNLRVSPGVGSAVLGVSESFLQALVEQVTHGAVPHLVPSDTGLFEFLMLSILERANRDLQFPFRFSLEPFEAPLTQEHGIAVECVASLAEAVGVIELFLPAKLLTEARGRHENTEPVSMAVSWPIMTTCGHADLSLQEMADLQVGDILLITSKHQLLLPEPDGGFQRGWRATYLDESKPPQLRIEDYFERKGLIMESQAEPAGQSDTEKPDLTTLPVRVQIVLGQLDMTLAELNKLTPGTIVELDRDKSERVQLAVNGKIAGTGELVEIEGRLGVRISNWATR